jgi:hypothetical protein
MPKINETNETNEVKIIENLLASYDAIESDASTSVMEEQYRGEKADKIISQKNQTMSSILTELGNLFESDSNENDSKKTDILMKSSFVGALNQAIEKQKSNFKDDKDISTIDTFKAKYRDIQTQRATKEIKEMKNKGFARY